MHLEQVAAVDPELKLAEDLDPSLIALYADPALGIGTPRAETTPDGSYMVLDLSHPQGNGTVRVSYLYGMPFEPTLFKGPDRPRLLGKMLVDGLIPPGAFNDAIENCSAELEGHWEMPVPEFKDTCFQGSIGDAALGARAAKKAADIAISAWGEFQQRFDIAHQMCAAAEEGEELRQQLASHHNEQMSKMTQAKANADLGAAIVGAFASVVPSFGVSLVGIFSANSSIHNAKNMQLSELSYQEEIGRLQAEVQLRQCLIEANQHLVGARTAALQVDRALIEGEQAFVGFRSMQTRVAQLVAEGAAIVERERQSRIPGFAHHFWLEERIDTARQSFERAKRFAYLFGRALEYEKQQSNVALGEILSSRGPYDLQRAFGRYAYSAINKTVFGNAPEGAPFALRLRDDVLKLSDSPQGIGERNLTAAQVFSRHLLSSAGALYGDDGRYIGQGVKFSLPKIPNVNQCAERLWDVHVQLSGGSKLKAWVELNGRPALRLRQRNTFASRMCSDSADWQTAFVRPSWTAEDWPQPGDEMAFTETVVKASAGTSFLSFETLGDGPFGATKLRGRGMYSEYEIVFPWEGLLSEGNTPTDFPLEDVIDIWVRIEPLYVVAGH